MPYFWGMECPVPLDQYLFDYLNPEGSLYNQYQNFFYNHEPGTYYEYSNIGIALIGLLVEEITGIPFFQFCQESIFNPLEMNETSWFLSGIDTTLMARPYNWNGNSYIPYPFYSYPDYPDGALKTSVDQLARFLMCYMGNGTFNNEVILNETTMDTILTLQIPELSDIQGLVWHRRSVAGIGEVWGHNGGDYGFATEMSFNDEHDIGVIACTNVFLDTIYIRTFGNLLLHYAMDSIVITSVPVLHQKISERFKYFPNPFGASTTFEYELKENATVTLSIFNYLGQEVATLIDGSQSKGTHEVHWNAEILPAGIYYCTLKIGNQVIVSKIVKMK
jgi:CubicO group peptidase (beta-lactamase class C family)